VRGLSIGQRITIAMGKDPELALEFYYLASEIVDDF